MSEVPILVNKHFKTNRPRLLIVEDDPGISDQLKWGLLKDYEVFTAADPDTALACFQEEMPPVVTLDLGLPPKPDEGKLVLNY